MINFDNSKFFYDPFPHCILDGFLENKIYDEICNEYPEQSYFEEVKSKHGDDKFKKYRFIEYIYIVFCNKSYIPILVLHTICIFYSIRKII